MALEAAVDSPETGELLRGEKAPFRQSSVIYRSGMAFAQDEDIPLRPSGLSNINIHQLKVQGSHYFYS
jgi:hypothetical protein